MLFLVGETRVGRKKLKRILLYTLLDIQNRITTSFAGIMVFQSSYMIPGKRGAYTEYNINLSYNFLCENVTILRNSIIPDIKTFG